MILELLAVLYYQHIKRFTNTKIRNMPASMREFRACVDEPYTASKTSFSDTFLYRYIQGNLRSSQGRHIDFTYGAFLA